MRHIWRSEPQVLWGKHLAGSWGHLREECGLRLEEEEKGNVTILEYLEKFSQPMTLGSAHSAGSTNRERLLVLTGFTVVSGARDSIEDRSGENASLTSTVKPGARVAAPTPFLKTTQGLPHWVCSILARPRL